MLVTAASELARNALIYGGGGTVTWEVRRDGPKVGVQLTFEDRGPGIPDLGLAMTAGWNSGTGMGLGLSGAKRLVHEFSIGTVIGVGTNHCYSVEITRVRRGPPDIPVWCKRSMNVPVHVRDGGATLNRESHTSTRRWWTTLRPSAKSYARSRVRYSGGTRGGAYALRGLL